MKWELLKDSFGVQTHQIRASVAEGSPVLRKISLTSGPDTRPSMSLSVLLKSSSYLALSAGNTTHCHGKKTTFSKTDSERHDSASKQVNLLLCFVSFSCSLETHTELPSLKSFLIRCSSKLQRNKNIRGRVGLVLTGAAAGVGAGTGAGLGGWGMVLEAAWEERLSLTEGGDGNRGITGGTEVFFLLDGGTRGGGRDMGTGSPSRALYTRYMAWEITVNKTITSHRSGYTSVPQSQVQTICLQPLILV